MVIASRQIFAITSVTTFLLILFLPGCFLQGPTGPAGQDGKNGNTIISGSYAPGRYEGNVGDYFIDTINGLIYGPKTSTGWGTGKSLRSIPGKYSIKQGILYASDTTSSGNWDISFSSIRDSSFVQCLVRQNQGYMWMTPTWYLSKDNRYVRIIRNSTAAIGYEYQITVINP
jgi:hypothetical protein